MLIGGRVVVSWPGHHVIEKINTRKLFAQEFVFNFLSMVPSNVLCLNHCGFASDLCSQLLKRVTGQIVVPDAVLNYKY